MTGNLKTFLADQRGATAIEYALIGSLVSVFIIGAMMGLNTSIVEMFDYIRDSIIAVTG
jgi:pilus assembly protein Flp/PilA